ncbi:MAG: glycosyltransferase family 2 protein [Duncaniella sp.]|nr:glycosyltransferase family 2 protein [Duncaniella sp.]
MISVIIPAYNAATFIADCLDSLIAQDFTDWEAVVVDDGSTDSTPLLAESYAARDRRIRLARRPNGGLSAARNFGLDRANGHYITFLDADDRLFPNALSILLSSLGNDTDVVTAQLSASPAPPAATHKAATRVMSGLEALADGLYQNRVNTSACGKLYTREILHKVRFREGIWYEDLEFFSRLCLASRHIAVTDTPVYYYRPNPSSFIHTFSPARLDVLRVTADIQQLVHSACPELLPAARDRHLSASFNMFALMSIHDPSGHTYSDLQDECWKTVRSLRRASLFNPRVRLKNRLGILLSYLGRRAFMLVARRLYS